MFSLALQKAGAIMQSVKEYSALLRILIKDKLRTGSFFGFKRSDKRKEKSKLAKIFTIIGIGFLILMLSSYLVIFVFSGTTAAAEMGLHKEFLMFLIAMSQLVVFFFGISAVMGYLYFSKDNSLLTTLPISHNSIFLAKFSMAYIAEFTISAFFLVTSFASYAVALIYNGISVDISFVFLSLLAIVAAPMMPLLIITFISVPVMQIVKLLQKNSLLQSIVISAIFLSIMALYFIALGSFTAGVTEENGFVLPIGLISAMKNLNKIFIFNVPLVDAMLTGKKLVNTLIYIAINIGGLGIAVLLSSIFYAKSIKSIIEGSGGREKKSKVTDSNQRSFSLSFLKKELKTLIQTPMLFMQSIMGIVLSPLMVLLLGSFDFGMGEAEGMDKSILFSAGFTLYISSMLANGTNMLSLIGFSREGKHLLVLKSLPISAKQIVDAKLRLSFLQTGLSAVIVTVVFIIKNNSVLFGLGVFATLITIGFALSCFSLYSDLKNPTLNWKNVTELTKNNKKSLKPALTMLGIGLIYMVMGSIFAFVESIPLGISGLSFFASCLLVNCIFVIIAYRKLYDNPEKLLEAVEG